MNPSLRAKYGLRTEEDVAIAERFLAAASKAGWLGTQAHALLQFYATLAPSLESGKITPNDALNQLWDFGALQNIPEEQRAPLLQWHETTAAYIESHDGNLPHLPKPTAEEAHKELAEIERVFREEPANYWQDELMQNRRYDLLSIAHGSAKPLATATPKHLQRLGEIEKLMGDQSSAYWAPATGPSLQSEYRNILSLAAPEGAAATPGDAGTTTQGDQ
jgi:hypothetical protein